MQQDSPIYAAVDLGSNSFHLLVAREQQGRIVYIDREKENVRLAEGLSPDGTLDEQAQLRALEVLQRFGNLIEGIDRQCVRAVGTNTLRAAKNGGAFLARAEAALGFPIEVISGREEARLIYLGLAKDFTPDKEKRLVIDIGGGSTEVILGDRLPREMESLYMGCVSFTRHFFPEGRINQESYQQAVIAAQQEVLGISKQYRSKNWHHAVGSSGTIRTVLKIIDYDEAMTTGIVTRNDIEVIAKKVVACGNINSLNLNGISISRRPVFAGGLAILHALFIELEIEELHVSSYTMKEGIIYELIGRSRHIDKREETIHQLIEQYNIDIAQAKRVEKIALNLLKHYQGTLEVDRNTAKSLLHWASYLHELGLAVAHSGYQKHGAYFINNADLPGFNRLEQSWIGFLILNHRRGLKKPEERYGFKADWGLLLIFRIACLMERRRQDHTLQKIRLFYSGDQCSVTLSNQWSEKNPVAMQDLQSETGHWADLNVTFRVHIGPEESRAEVPQPDELSAMTSLKKKAHKKLAKNNITQVEELTELKKKELKKMLGINKKKANKIIREAKKLDAKFQTISQQNFSALKNEKSTPVSKLNVPNAEKAKSSTPKVTDKSGKSNPVPPIKLISGTLISGAKPGV